jgi:hypothetical protein
MTNFSVIKLDVVFFFSMFYMLAVIGIRVHNEATNICNETTITSRSIIQSAGISTVMYISKCTRFVL